jgi:hypothetical protein
MKYLLVFLVGCAASSHDRIVRSTDDILKEAKLLPIEDACKLLNQALASGDYSMQRRGGADTLMAANDEYVIGHARETYCRQVEKRAVKIENVGGEDNATTLRAIAWSEGEDELVRKRAAQRLAELIPKINDKETLTKLVEMELRYPLPAWYLIMGIEDAIEARYAEVTEGETLKPWTERLQPLLQRAQEAKAKVGKLAMDNAPSDAIDSARQAYKQSETEICAVLKEAFATLRPAPYAALVSVSRASEFDCK